jgi:GNAT superfamily N-acetyltransferase
VSVLAFREGGSADLRTTFELGEHTWDTSRMERNLLPADHARDPGELEAQWQRERPLLEFIEAQADGCYLICEDGDEVVGYTRVARFGAMDELTELTVAPSYAGRGVGRALLERCWPRSPTRDLGRVVLGLGMPADLSLFTEFGAMPVSGHWHLRQRAEEYLERRSQEVDVSEPAVHAMTSEHAVTEWKNLEPPAIGHERPLLHDFFGRTRTCLAIMDPDGSGAVALCWVSSAGEIGPAVARTTEDLVPVVLAALDRVSKSQEPESLGVFCTTDSWWLLDRLRQLGFRVHWPSWLMCSEPLPGLDRYLPTRPARLL